MRPVPLDTRLLRPAGEREQVGIRAQQRSQLGAGTRRRAMAQPRSTAAHARRHLACVARAQLRLELGVLPAQAADVALNPFGGCLQPRELRITGGDTSRGCLQRSLALPEFKRGGGRAARHRPEREGGELRHAGRAIGHRRMDHSPRLAVAVGHSERLEHRRQPRDLVAVLGDRVLQLQGAAERLASGALSHLKQLFGGFEALPQRCQGALCVHLVRTSLVH